MYNHRISEQTTFIKSKARELGFDYCGISKADFLKEEAPRLEKWLSLNMHGTMSYMENHFEKRLDPRKLVDGTRSVVSLLLNYFPEEKQNEDCNYKISKYAYGDDYHEVIRSKLNALLNAIREQFGSVEGRGFVDSAPVMDKVWAKKSGNGWIGKNSNLLTKKSGSYFFIANLLLDIDLEYDGEMKDYCGSCTRCIDACPTTAITEPYVVDGSRCISYLTIELKNEIPSGFTGKMENWAFGCDICQDVCPWNRFSLPNKTADFNINQAIKSFNDSEWEEINEDAFKILFKNSPIKRTKWKGLKRNVEFLKN